MSTRSTITLKTKEGQYKSIYCHFDGDLDHNGLILETHYTTYDKVAELVDLGAIRGLGANIGPGDLNDTDLITEAYHRDHGEPKQFTLVDSYDEIELEEYNYLFEDGKWYVESEYFEMIPLGPPIAHFLKVSSETPE